MKSLIKRALRPLVEEKNDGITVEEAFRNVSM